MTLVNSETVVPKTVNLKIVAHSHHESDNLLEVPRYFRWKGLFDRPAAAILLIPGLPLIGILVLLVRLTSRGPGIFRQARVGQNGRVFTLFKIRTMRLDAEAESGAKWATKDDPRVTKIGNILRNLHLDELPQLFNVTRGEMSLVGPRPERPEFVEVLAENVPRYSDRLLVPPGVTGMAQLNLPPDTDLCSVCRKVALDINYIGRAGPIMDARVVFCTIARIPKIPALDVLRLFRLRHQPNGEHCPCAACEALSAVSEDSTLRPDDLRGGPRKQAQGGNGKPKPLGPQLNGNGHGKPRASKPR